MSIFTGQINVNDTLNFINTSILSNIKEGLVLTKDYALELGGRYIQYAITTNIIYSVIFLVLFIALLCYMKRFIRWSKKRSEDSDGVSRMGFIFGRLIPTIIFLCLTISYINTTIKRYFVPEIQMYQVIMDIKNGQTNNN